MEPPNGREADRATRLARQRTHLANERTFLAWIRTSLAFLAGGMVLAKADVFLGTWASRDGAELGHVLKQLGELTFVLGIVLCLVAGWRFFSMRRQIRTGVLGFSGLPDLLCAAMVLVMFLAMLAISLHFHLQP